MEPAIGSQGTAVAPMRCMHVAARNAVPSSGHPGHATT